MGECFFHQRQDHRLERDEVVMYLLITGLKMIVKNSRCLALTTVIFMAAILFTFITASLLLSSLDLRLTGNLKRGDAALHVADGGVQHALIVIPAGTTFPYSAETAVVPLTSYPSISGYDYSVTGINTAGGTQAILTSQANGPNGVKKVIKAYVGRGGFGLGATSLPGSSAGTTETNFSGTSFSINGNDNCNAAPAVPGIAVTDPALATEITNDTTSDGGLASNQMNLVTGAGGTPSVVVIPPLSQTVSQIADGYLALPHTDLAGGNYSGNSDWGTAGTPRITRVTGDAQIQGTIEGYGVLIVDGALDIAGNFTFHGLVIARGNVQVQITGNAGIYGSLLIKESTVEDPAYELDVRGNAHIRYDSCALAAADSWATLPKTTRLSAWQEVM